MLTHALAAALAAVAAAPQDTSPHWSTTGAQIAFDRTRPAAVELVPSSGGRPSRLAPGRVAAWQPGGGALAVRDGARTRIVDRAGGEIAVVDGALIGWSPDGSRTAWIAPDGLYVGDGSAANARRIVSLPVTSAAWSRDGTRLAFTTRTGVSVVNADGTGLHAVAGGGADNVSWSFDSSTLAWVAGGFVWIESISGQAPTAIGPGGEPAWAPLTPHLAYVTAKGTLQVVFVPNLAGAPLVEAAAVDPRSAPAWSPDGRFLAYAAARDCERDGIYVRLSGARTERRLTNDCHVDGRRGAQTLRGTALRDVIRAGRGRDRILGLAGNDLIEARNGFRDTIDCGSGRDRAVVDRADVVRHCEEVSR